MTDNRGQIGVKRYFKGFFVHKNSKEKLPCPYHRPPLFAPSTGSLLKAGFIARYIGENTLFRSDERYGLLLREKNKTNRMTLGFSGFPGADVRKSWKLSGEVLSEN